MSACDLRSCCKASTCGWQKHFREQRTRAEAHVHTLLPIQCGVLPGAARGRGAVGQGRRAHNFTPASNPRPGLEEGISLQSMAKRCWWCPMIGACPLCVCVRAWQTGCWGSGLWCAWMGGTALRGKYLGATSSARSKEWMGCRCCSVWCAWMGVSEPEGKYDVAKLLVEEGGSDVQKQWGSVIGGGNKMVSCRSKGGHN
eukprot:1142849-Pelagomonas_calceolata.AAC.5